MGEIVSGGRDRLRWARSSEVGEWEAKPNQTHTLSHSLALTPSPNPSPTRRHLKQQEAKLTHVVGHRESRSLLRIARADGEESCTIGQSRVERVQIWISLDLACGALATQG